MTSQMTNALRSAELSFGVVIIPSSPLKQEIAKASLAITKKCENKNIIDNDRFPAHVSLYLGGTDMAVVPTLISGLQRVTKRFLMTPFSADRLTRSSVGYISISCINAGPLRELLTVVIETCGELHRRNPRYRPHVIERWSRFSNEQQQLYAQFGTDKTALNARPHLSVADVTSDEDAKTAMQIARKTITLPSECPIAAIQLVDIGHRNEQWAVLDSWDARDRA